MKEALHDTYRLIEIRVRFQRSHADTHIFTVKAETRGDIKDLDGGLYLVPLVFTQILIPRKYFFFFFIVES
jgi:hypothetical protein